MEKGLILRPLGFDFKEFNRLSNSNEKKKFKMINKLMKINK